MTLYKINNRLDVRLGIEDMVFVDMAQAYSVIEEAIAAHYSVEDLGESLYNKYKGLVTVDYLMFVYPEGDAPCAFCGV